MSRSKNTDKQRFAAKWVVGRGAEQREVDWRTCSTQELYEHRWVYTNEVPHKQRMSGFEYWSRRPLNYNSGACPGKKTKVLTHRIERRRGKAKTRTELLEAQNG